jgi:hypothetical protein
VGVGALTGTDFVVKMSGDSANACNVDWWVAEAATITRRDFIGNIYAGGAITITGAAPTSPFHGRALAKAAVTLTNSTFQGCVSEQEPEVAEAPFCPTEAKGDIVYVKYTNAYNETEIAVMAPDSKVWYKGEYEAAFKDWSQWMYPINVPMTETIRDETSVYAAYVGVDNVVKEFHIDLTKNVVNDCKLYHQNTVKFSDCVSYPILESGSSSSLTNVLGEWLSWYE